MEAEEKLWKEESEKVRKEKEEKEVEETPVYVKIAKIKNIWPHIFKRMPSNSVDIPGYFKTMENNFEVYNIDEKIWVHLLLSLMNDEAQKCIWNMTDISCYPVVKRQILMIHSLKAFEPEVKPLKKFNEIREQDKIDKLKFERMKDESDVKRFDWRYMNVTSDVAMQCIFGKENAVCDMMIDNSRCNGKCVSKICNAELVSCELLMDTLIDVKRTDYVLMEPVIVKSHVESFANVVVADATEVLRNIEVVTSEIVCSNICKDEELSVNMGDDDEASVCIGSFEGDDVACGCIGGFEGGDVACVDNEVGRLIEVDVCVHDDDDDDDDVDVVIGDKVIKEKCVFENFEVVSNEALCDNGVCADEEVIANMVSNEKSCVDIGCIKDDVVFIDADLMKIVEDKVAFVEVEIEKVIEEDYDDELHDVVIRSVLDAEFTVFQITGGNDLLVDNDAYLVAEQFDK